MFEFRHGYRAGVEISDEMQKKGGNLKLPIVTVNLASRNCRIF